ncbi:MAG TPA: diguanylate cyclase [Patescibacteria group bacterium]|nr:diguanylate cyclase [Patescibacteria group bacterium]
MGIREKLYSVMILLLAFIGILWGLNFYVVGTLEDTAPLVNRAAGLRWRAYALAALNYEYNVASPFEQRALVGPISEGISQYQSLLDELNLTSRSSKLGQDWSVQTREQFQLVVAEWKNYRISLIQIMDNGDGGLLIESTLGKKTVPVASLVQTADRLVSSMEADSLKEIHFLKNLSLALFGLALTAMLAAIYFAAVQIIRPLRALLSSFTEISSGATDLNQRIGGHRRDEIGQIIHCFNHFVSKVQDYESGIKFLSDHDTLTGLPNRRNFLERLKQVLPPAKEKGRNVAVLFLDVDEFKSVNDSLGHAAGDLLLQAVASRLIRCVRNDEMVARLGGDEFTVLLQPRDKKEDVALVAQRILETFRRPFEIWEQRVSISVSIGISIFPQDGEDVSKLLKKADDAMYLAKEQGKNQYAIYQEPAEQGVIITEVVR